MIQFVVDRSKCTRCGQCMFDCPSRIIEMPDGAMPLVRPEDEEGCMQCQHCLAICPAAAISIFGRDPARSIPLDANAFPTLEKMTTLVRGRRSVRRYRDENVDSALIQRLLTTLANAPSGVNRRGLNFSVIDDKAVMQRFRLKALSALVLAKEQGRVPETFAYLMDAVPAWFHEGRDVIFRGAPHLLVISAGPEAICPQEDVSLAMAYFELMAQSAGLGTVWCGLAKMTRELIPELKTMIGLAPGQHYYAMLFGVPAFKYARTVQRDDAACIRRIEA
jgi:nitroreductase/NAD-dependent dihydropyrimidine dehydrogenase PreA subunit